MELPVRKHLPHTPPPLVMKYAAESPFFITVCTDRLKNQTSLTDRNNAVAAIAAFENMRCRGLFSPYSILIMPDHVHFIAVFSGEASMGKVVREWKRWIARETGVVWQNGYFDYRIRNDKDLDDKMEYIALNPVRKGLCGQAEDWPFRMTWLR